MACTMTVGSQILKWPPRLFTNIPLLATALVIQLAAGPLWGNHSGAMMWVGMLVMLIMRMLMLMAVLFWSDEEG